jgi:hypothetical protein
MYSADMRIKSSLRIFLSLVLASLPALISVYLQHESGQAVDQQLRSEWHLIPPRYPASTGPCVEQRFVSGFYDITCPMGTGGRTDNRPVIGFPWTFRVGTVTLY